VGPAAGLNAVAKRKHPTPCRKSNLGHPARSLVSILWLLTDSFTIADVTDGYYLICHEM